MTGEPYREDDLLSDFGEYLKKCDFLILALSGNQQGRYWFQMENYRKAPDIIAVRNDIALVGEAKIRSRDLFKMVDGRKSDYQSMQYLLDTAGARQQLSEMIMTNLSYFTKVQIPIPQLQAIVVGGDLFTGLQDYLTDDRIAYFVVDKETGDVTGQRVSRFWT